VSGAYGQRPIPNSYQRDLFYNTSSVSLRAAVACPRVAVDAEEMPMQPEETQYWEGKLAKCTK
jgi:hypothetical protein